MGRWEGKQSRHVRREEAVTRSLGTVCKSYRHSLTVSLFKDSPNKETYLAKAIKIDTLTKYVASLLTPTQLHIETSYRNNVVFFFLMYSEIHGDIPI